MSWLRLLVRKYWRRLAVLLAEPVNGNRTRRSFLKLLVTIFGKHFREDFFKRKSEPINFVVVALFSMCFKAKVSCSH